MLVSSSHVLGLAGARPSPNITQGHRFLAFLLDRKPGQPSSLETECFLHSKRRGEGAFSWHRCLKEQDVEQHQVIQCWFYSRRGGFAAMGPAITRSFLDLMCFDRELQSEKTQYIRKLSRTDSPQSHIVEKQWGFELFIFFSILFFFLSIAVRVCFMQWEHVLKSSNAFYLCVNERTDHGLCTSSPKLQQDIRRHVKTDLYRHDVIDICVLQIHHLVANAYLGLKRACSCRPRYRIAAVDSLVVCYKFRLLMTSLPRALFSCGVAYLAKFCKKVSMTDYPGH